VFCRTCVVVGHCVFVCFFAFMESTAGSTGSGGIHNRDILVSAAQQCASVCVRPHISESSKLSDVAYEKQARTTFDPTKPDGTKTRESDGFCCFGVSGQIADESEPLQMSVDASFPRFESTCGAKRGRCEARGARQEKDADMEIGFILIDHCSALRGGGP
jgi:hypothetical protein